jgi:flagellar L-ring protein precursor FlgH
MLTVTPVARAAIGGLLLSLAASAAHAQAAPAAARGRPANAAPAMVDSLAAQPAMRQSWTSDKMRFGVGDIVTILIVERTAASANLTDNNTDNRKKGMDLHNQPPSSPGAPSSNVAVTMGFDNNGDSRKSGQALRQNDFRSTISARVIAVSPTGMLRIRGHKMVNVDKNQQDVTVTGWIRPQDVGVGNNSVESTRIADAEIDYGQKGALGTPKSGILSKVLGLVWP